MTAARVRFVFAAAALANLILLAAIPGYFSHDELEWLGRTTNTTLPWSNWGDLSPLQWRPLAFDLWLVLDRLIGDRPWLQHAIFALIGITNAALLVQLLRRMGTGEATSFGSGAVFLWLPSVIYTHGWVATLADLLCLNMLLAIALWLADQPRKGFVEGVVVIAATLTALASKESAVVFPALLLSLAATGIERERVLRAAALSGACVAGYLALRWDALFHAPRDSLLYSTSISVIPTRWLEYFLFPFVPPLLESGTVLQKSLTRLVLAGVLHTSLCIALAQAGWRWFVAYLVLFTITLGPVLILGASANHYAYLASAVACIVIAYAWSRLDRLPRALSGIAIVVALAHGAGIGLKLREIGAMQTRFFATLETVQQARPDAALRIATVQPADAWLLHRWLLAGAHFRKVVIAGRLIPSDATSADLLMRSDGCVEEKP